MRRGQFVALPIPVPCSVPVVPGTPKVRELDGRPVPLEERTELCAVDAYLMVGAMTVCDLHLVDVCELAEGELGQPRQIAIDLGRGQTFDDRTPWHRRRRHSQATAAGKLVQLAETMNRGRR